MAKRSVGSISLLLLFIFISVVSNLLFISYRSGSTSCDGNSDAGKRRQEVPQSVAAPNPLAFMNKKLVLLVSHDLSLSGGSSLLMDLAYHLRSVGAKVCWITDQMSLERDEVINSLERRLEERKVKVLPAMGRETRSTALSADLLVLNTVMAGKWLDRVPKENVSHVLPKVLWWIHEMQDPDFEFKILNKLPLVAAVMIDSHAAAKYWERKTQVLRIEMPRIYVVHPGNSKDTMEIAVDSVAKRLLREHVRESLGIQHDDVVFGMISSVSLKKGQDLFLQSFYKSLQLIQQRRLWVPPIHAVIVGFDINDPTEFESRLRYYTRVKKIQDRVHFVSKSLTVAPYLAAIDVFVQNSQTPGECFGRTTIEAMAFNRPVLGTAVGGTPEIVVNESTGLLHPAGVVGITPLANNIVTLATHVFKRVEMGKKAYETVEERFLDSHLALNIAEVLWDVLAPFDVVDAVSNAMLP